MEQTEISTQKEKDIKGWLAFFVYVWIGLGSILSVVLSLILLISQHADLDVSIFILLYDVFPLLIGVATVRAFVLEKSNAVSLARTFLIMRIMLGVVILMLGWVGAQPVLYTYSIGGCVQCVIWLVYLRCSNQVKDVIPAEACTWNKFEKIIVTIYTLLVLLLLLGLFVFVGMREQKMATNKHIEQANYMGDTISTVVYRFPNSTLVTTEIGADSLAIIQEDFVQWLKIYVKNDESILKSLQKDDEVICALLDANREVVYSVQVKIQNDTVMIEKKKWIPW